MINIRTGWSGQDVILYRLIWSGCHPVQADLVRMSSRTGWSGQDVIPYRLIWSGCHPVQADLVRMSSRTGWSGQDVIPYRLIWSGCHPVQTDLVRMSSRTGWSGQDVIPYRLIWSGCHPVQTDLVRMPSCIWGDTVRMSSRTPWRHQDVIVSCVFRRPSGSAIVPTTEVQQPVSRDHIGGYRHALMAFQGIEMKFGLCLPRFRTGFTPAVPVGSVPGGTATPAWRAPVSPSVNDVMRSDMLRSWPPNALEMGCYSLLEVGAGGQGLEVRGWRSAGQGAGALTAGSVLRGAILNYVICIACWIGWPR